MGDKTKYDYDLALSFAGEDRAYVESLADTLKEFGLNIFYDKYYESELWGKDLYAQLDRVYRLNSRFCILFISQNYKRKLWTNHERISAQARAFSEKEEYILPIKLDDTEIPGIRPTIGYLDARRKTNEEILEAILAKLGRKEELQSVIDTLNYYLGDYEIKIEGAFLHFKCEAEYFEASYPIRLFIELQRIGLLVELFIMTQVVPN